ncbi:MAG: alpha/beta hydrolase-fold protein [Gemmatimonadota bacterium]
MKLLRNIGAAVAACVQLMACSHLAPSGHQADPGLTGVGLEAQPEPYTVPAEISQRIANAPEGQLSSAALYQSKVFGGLNFRYRVYVPAQYRPGHPAALMVFQDASSVYLGLMKTPQVFDNLIQAGDMPVTIGLFLDPGTVSGTYVQATDRDKRAMEYDTLDDTYARFLIDEIIPDVIRSKYEVVDDPNGWAIAGQSSGGIASFTVGWQRPNAFRKILTQNGSFVNIHGGNAYPSMIRTAGPKPLRVYLLSGTKDLNNQFGSWLDANKAMFAALTDRGYAVRFRPGDGAHFPPVQAQADFPNALRWLWKGYTIR